MSVRFDAERGLVVVPVRITGPRGESVVQCAVDTGATSTLFSREHLVRLGYDVASTRETVQVTTGSGVVNAPRLPVDTIAALDQEKRDFSVICHTLPASASVEGLLGLDFIRGQRLTIDFRRSEVVLE